MTGNEIEVKFLLKSLPALQGRLQSLGAALVQPRVFESNLRFDDAAGSLTASGRVLRLRQDSAVRLTYKDPPQPGQGVSVRREVEFVVSDFEAARQFLEALGFSVMVMYEKYRAMYRLDDVLVTLDETPLGSFAEIEGPAEESIRKAADRLGLDWEARSLLSYLALFGRACHSLNLAARHMSFAELAGVLVAPADLGLIPADSG